MICRSIETPRTVSCRPATKPTTGSRCCSSRTSTGETAQRVLPMSAVIAPRFQAWLRFRNAARWNIYVSVNAVAPGRSRTKDAIAAVRHVFLEWIATVRGFWASWHCRRDLPSPSYMVHTSPDEFMFCGGSADSTWSNVEALQKCLARELRTDSAATACSQMTRLPGFVNHKHELPTLVRCRVPRVERSVHAVGLSESRGQPSPRTFRAIRTALMMKQVRPDPLERARRFLVAHWTRYLWSTRRPSHVSDLLSAGQGVRAVRRRGARAPEGLERTV